MIQCRHKANNGVGYIVLIAYPEAILDELYTQGIPAIVTGQCIGVPLITINHLFISCCPGSPGQCQGSAVNGWLDWLPGHEYDRLHRDGKKRICATSPIMDPAI
jgi:hypothetical protein